MAVDHSEDAFQKFRDKIGEPVSDVERQISVLAVGEEGCGKSSLIHRCADWFSAELRTAGVDSVVVDLSTETGPGLTAEARLAFWAGRIIDKVLMSNLFAEKDQVDDLKSRKSDANQALPFLADMLEHHGFSLHVILPGIELLPEAEGLAGLTRPHLVLYTETSNETVRRALSTATSLSSMIGLEVGELSIEDGWRFVQARMAAAGPGAGGPSLDKATVEKYMRARIDGKGRTTIRELNLICQAVFADVQRRKRQKVEYRDFSDYYLRNAAL